VLPFTVNAIDLPLTGEPLAVSVADRFAVLPYVPLAAAATRLVFTAPPVTVSELLPEDPELVPEVGANVAMTPVVYVPAEMPARLTPERVATPLPFVVALPTDVPFSVNATDWLERPEPPCVSVAESVVVPPELPDAVAAAMLVAFRPS